MKTIQLAIVLLIALGSSSHRECQAGIATSTVFQDGNKYVYPGIGQDPDDPNLNDEDFAGSASRIGIFEFDFPSPLASLDLIQARIRFWVQMPSNAEGDSAPWIVFAEEGMADGKSLYRSLLNGETNRAISTDIRISANLPDSGPGVVEKKMLLFEDLTRQQGLALSSILAANPNHRVEAWLVSDSVTNITVPANGESFDFVDGMIVSTVTPFSSTLDIKYVPEPSSSLVFTMISLCCLRRVGKRMMKWSSTKSKSQEPAELCYL